MSSGKEWWLRENWLDMEFSLWAFALDWSMFLRESRLHAPLLSLWHRPGMAQWEPCYGVTPSPMPVSKAVHQCWHLACMSKQSFGTSLVLPLACDQRPSLTGRTGPQSQLKLFHAFPRSTWGANALQRSRLIWRYEYK